MCLQISIKVVKIVLKSGIVTTPTKNDFYYEACASSAFQRLSRVDEDFVISKYLYIPRRTFVMKTMMLPTLVRYSVKPPDH